MFHSSLLMPYKETRESRAQFQHPPPELIGNEEEYEVEQIINHRHHGKWHQLQYLIQWKGYSAADNTWEPANQVHANDLVKKYHCKHPQEETRYKTVKRIGAKAATFSIMPCPQPTLQISLPPLPLVSLSTWTLPSHSPLSLKWKPQWSTSRTVSQFPQRLWQPPTSLVSCCIPPDLYALLLSLPRVWTATIDTLRW